MGKTIDLTCAQCGAEFQKALNEYNRRVKTGQKHFLCSRSCSVKWNHKNGSYDYDKSTKNIKPYSGNVGPRKKKDELTPFRWFVLRAKYRASKRSYEECDVTPQYLKKLFEQQNGKCLFTGWDLILPKGTDYAWSECNPRNASLDRIDNSKGYIEGNVRFICVIANLARQTYTDEALIEFCRAVSNNHPNKVPT